MYSTNGARSFALFAPPRQYMIDLLAEAIARVTAVNAARQELVIASLDVTHVRPDRQLYRVLVETLGRRRSSDAPAVLLARMHGNLLQPIGRAAWIELANTSGEPRYEIGIQFSTPF